MLIELRVWHLLRRVDGFFRQLILSVGNAWYVSTENGWCLHKGGYCQWLVGADQQLRAWGSYGCVYKGWILSARGFVFYSGDMVSAVGAGYPPSPGSTFRCAIWRIDGVEAGCVTIYFILFSQCPRKGCKYLSLTTNKSTHYRSSYHKPESQCP